MGWVIIEHRRTGAIAGAGKTTRLAWQSAGERHAGFARKGYAARSVDMPMAEILSRMIWSPLDGEQA